MATKGIPPPIEIEDASQLSILAYQVRTRGKRVVDLQAFLERLNSDQARRIAEAIAAVDSAASTSVGDDTRKLANYYLQWADDTAANARTVSRRTPVGEPKE